MLWSRGGFLHAGIACIRNGALYLIPLSGEQIAVWLSDIRDVRETHESARGWTPFHTMFNFKTPEFDRIGFVVFDDKPWRKYIKGERQ